MEKANKNFIRELVIIGADPRTIDKETYSEEKIDGAIRALREFGETVEGGSLSALSETVEGSWGSLSALDDVEDDGGWD